MNHVLLTKNVLNRKKKLKLYFFAKMPSVETAIENTKLHS